MKTIKPICKDPFKNANLETRSLAELTHLARVGINARGRQVRVKEGGPPLEYGLDPPTEFYNHD